MQTTLSPRKPRPVPVPGPHPTSCAQTARRPRVKPGTGSIIPLAGDRV